MVYALKDYNGVKIVTPQADLSADRQALNENFKFLVDGLLATRDIMIPSADYYVVVAAGTSDTDRAVKLRLAYSTAAAFSPTAAKRAAVIVPPGRYDFGSGDGSGAGLVLDTEFVDLIGFDEPNTILTSAIGMANHGTVEQTADDVHITSMTIENSNASYGPATDNTDPAAYFPETGKHPKTVNVTFRSNDTNVWSTRLAVEYAGTYSNCTGGNYSLGGGGGTASGTFKYCLGGDQSFAGGGIASGTFTSCTGSNSFGGGGGTASGDFTYCLGGNQSFASGGIASGTFTGCTAGYNSFGGGGGGTASGQFTDCTGGLESFGGGYGVGGIASGTFTNCTGGFGSFGGGFGGTAGTGYFTNCTGGGFSFGGFGTASGTFTNCTGGDGSFGGLNTASGIFTNCTGGAYSFGGDDTASGQFTNCVGGSSSFGGNGGTANGAFRNCAGSANSFAGNSGTDSGATFARCDGGASSFAGSGTYFDCTVAAAAYP